MSSDLVTINCLDVTITLPDWELDPLIVGFVGIPYRARIDQATIKVIDKDGLAHTFVFKIDSIVRFNGNLLSFTQKDIW